MKAMKSFWLSIFVWGSGQILICKQYVKGLLFLLVQVLVVGIELRTGYWLEWLMGRFRHFEMRRHGGFFSRGIWGLITLGVRPGAKNGDHSMLLMINGVIVMILLLLILAIYGWNLADAYRTGKYMDDTGKCMPSGAYFKKLYQEKFVYIVLTPVMLLILFVSVMPMTFSILTAFTNYQRGNLPPANLIDWVGIDNFSKLFHVPIWSGTFMGVLCWTVIWTAASTLSCYFFGMLQALILNSKHVKCKKLFRTVMILPWAMPSMICLLVFRNIFNGQFGPLNQFLLNIGWISHRIPFLTDPVLSKITVILVNLWLGFGSSMVMISGVLSNMDYGMYEAANIDGASAFSQFRFLTLPHLLRVTMPLLVMNFAGNFNNFGAVFFLTQGGPANPDYQFAGDTDILISWIYKMTLDNQMYSMAAVMSILIFIVVGLVAFWNFRRTAAFKEV